MIPKAARAVLLALLSLGPLVMLSATSPVAQGAEGVDPLTVTIDRLTPGSLTVNARPDRRVVVAGRVVNTSQRTWTDLSVYLVNSAVPLTTKAELSAAQASSPTLEVGSRITDAGLYVAVPDLAPGDAADYRLSVPVSRLGILDAPGVYWLGVHVLGTEENGERLDGADGRARTFLPVLPQGVSAKLTVGLQFRDHTAHEPDGTLAGYERWQAMVGPQGRLTNLLGVLGEADRFPVSVILDPAVLDSVSAVAAGNPPLDLAGSEPAQTSESPSKSGSAAPKADEPSPSEAAAKDWLQAFSTEVPKHRLLALPYGDLDVSSVADNRRPRLLKDATGQSAASMDERGLLATPLVAQRDGLLSPAAYAALKDTPVLLDQRADGPATTSEAEAASPADTMGLHRLTTGGSVVVVADDALTIGPTPEPVRSALAVRQRILAEAALMANAGATGEPLVVMLPDTWQPGGAWRQARFFQGLSASWIEPVDLGVLLAGSGADPTGPAVDPVNAFAYPAAGASAALPLLPLTAALEALDDAETLDEVLTDSEGILESLTRQVLVLVSNSYRDRPRIATQRSWDTSEQINAWLSDIVVNGPSFVTMSSQTGTFQVTLANRLDHPIRVGLDSTVSGTGLRLAMPETLELGPGQAQAIKIDAQATDVGIHKVLLQPVSESGAPVGEGLVLSVRSSYVGLILWIVMGVGATALFIVVILRIGRRIRQRSAQPDRAEDEVAHGQGGQ